MCWHFDPKWPTPVSICRQKLTKVAVRWSVENLSHTGWPLIVSNRQDVQGFTSLVCRPLVGGVSECNPPWDPRCCWGDPCDRRQLSLPESLLNPDDEAKSDATAEYLHTHEVHTSVHQWIALLQMKLGNFKQNDSYHWNWLRNWETIT